MGQWDHYRNEPIDEQNIRDYVADLSRQAQAAELSGDTIRAEYIHQGINAELDALGEFRNGGRR